MPPVLAAATTALTTIGFSAATASAVVSYGAQLAVSYAITSLSGKSKSVSQESQERTIESVGGTTAESVIYGRAKVSGTRYMLQKYNGFIYHGIALCRHPCEEVEEIFFDDKPSYHSDFSDVELALYDVQFFVENPSTAGTLTLTVEGDTYNYSYSSSETSRDIKDGFLALVADTDEFVFTNGGDSSLLVERISGTITNWDLSIQASTGTTTGVTPNIERKKGHAEIEKKFRLIAELGMQTEANVDLLAELDNDNVTHRWTSAHVLNSITHINVRWDSEFLRDNIGRLPAITVVMKGKNDIYDPRSNSYGYTDNAALVIRDWLTQPYAFSANNLELNNDTFIAAANLCDEDVIIDEDNTTQKRYRINTVVSTGTQPADVLTAFSKAVQAPIGWLGGGWHVKPAKYEIPEIELTVDDFAGNLQFTDKPSIQNRFNQIQGTFINPLQEWAAHDYPPVTVSDGLDTKTGDLSLTTEIDYIRAQRLAQLHLLLNYASAATQIHIKRLNTHVFVDSMIYLTVDDLGWNKKIFYVANREDHEDTTATLTLLPRQAEMFDWDYTQAQEVDTITSESIFDIREELQ